MKRHPRLLIALLACGVLATIAVIAWPASDPKEPTYAGKSLSAWIQGGGDNVLALPKANVDAINHIGTNALPCLLTWLQYNPPPWHEKLPRYVWRISWIRHRLRRSDERATDAVAAFWVLGKQARPAIPELAQLLDGTNYSARELALSSITALGADALPTLMDLITNRPAHRRFPTLMLVDAFEQLGVNGASAAPVLIDHLNDPNLQIAEASAFVLAAIGTNAAAPDAVVAALSASTEATNALVRASAVRALGSFGEYARPAVPMLLKALHDPIPDVQIAATDALIFIAPEALPRPRRPSPKSTPGF